MPDALQAVQEILAADRRGVFREAVALAPLWPGL
jgi:hypothetical protein